MLDTSPTLPTPTPVLDYSTQCRDKVRYYTFDTAHAEAVRLAGIEPKYIFTIYPCPHCNHLHIGRYMKWFTNGGY